MDFQWERELVHVRYELRRALAEGNRAEAPALLVRLRLLSESAAMFAHTPVRATRPVPPAARVMDEALGAGGPSAEHLAAEIAEQAGEVDRWRTRFDLD